MSAPEMLARAAERGARSGIPADPGLRIVFTAEQISSRLTRLAREIDADYPDSTLHVIGLLENSSTFAAELVRRLCRPAVCSFLSVATEDHSWRGFPLRQLTYTPWADIEKKNVLLVDGVLQTGVTLEFLLRSVQSRGAKSARSAVLVEKTNHRRIGAVPDYVGFRTREDFLVGYGLGYNGRYRELPHIAALNRREAG